MQIVECVVLLLTLTCADDKLIWNENVAPPGTANVKVESYMGFVTYDNPAKVLLWEKLKQAGARSEPVGCDNRNQTICVFPVGPAGLPLLESECFHWKAGGGRFLSDVNTDGIWSGVNMCGVELP